MDATITPTGDVTVTGGWTFAPASFDVTYTFAPKTEELNKYWALDKEKMENVILPADLLIDGDTENTKVPVVENGQTVTITAEMAVQAVIDQINAIYHDTDADTAAHPLRAACGAACPVGRGGGRGAGQPDGGKHHADAGRFLHRAVGKRHQR